MRSIEQVVDYIAHRIKTADERIEQRAFQECLEVIKETQIFNKQMEQIQQSVYKKWMEQQEATA